MTQILQIAWFCSSLISTLLCDYHIPKLFWEHNSSTIFFYFLASLVFCLCFFVCLVCRPLILLWRFFIMLKFYADVNPCKRNNGGCAHYCTRLNREYNCSCSSGFKLNADRHTCTGATEQNIKAKRNKVKDYWRIPISRDYFFNPLTPRSDQHVTSLKDIHTLFSKQVVRIREREPQDPLPSPLVATSMVRDDVSQKYKPAVNGVFFCTSHHKFAPRSCSKSLLGMGRLWSCRSTCSSIHRHFNSRSNVSTLLSKRTFL